MSKEKLQSEGIINHLTSIAKKDGLVSEDEVNFINVMNEEIDKYEAEFKKSVEDGKITSLEKTKLFNTRFKILQKALNIVREDLDVSDEEEELLNGLQIKLTELHHLEDKYTNNEE